MKRVLALVMAGGVGERLDPLTKYRAKSAVPFGGKFRLIDFTLSNCINSGMRQIFVLTQYMSESLLTHIQEGWNISSSRLGDFVYSVPAQQKISHDFYCGKTDAIEHCPSPCDNYQQRKVRGWYRGTADAIRQNINLISRNSVTDVLILAGDHIYKMNYSQILNYHRMKKADLTISTVRAKKEDAAGRLGVIGIDRNYRVTDFLEKPSHPKGMADDPEHVMASMGVYIFNVDALKRALQENGDDFGKEVIPTIISKNVNVFAWDYEKENKIEDFVVEVKKGQRYKILVDRTRDSSYWRDVGTIDSYYEASMDLVGVDPLFNLYGELWPFRTYQRSLPPSKCVIGGNTPESIVCEGCIISGGTVRKSILSPGVIVEKDTLVEESIIFDNVIIEPHVSIRRAIIDKRSVIRSGASLGYDPEADRRRGCTISDRGIVVVPKGSDIGHV